MINITQNGLKRTHSICHLMLMDTFGTMSVAHDPVHVTILF